MEDEKCFFASSTVGSAFSSSSIRRKQASHFSCSWVLSTDLVSPDDWKQLFIIIFRVTIKIVNLESNASEEHLPGDKGLRLRSIGSSLSIFLRARKLKWPLVDWFEIDEQIQD